ncbi:unnamed protein product [Chironomus riparius]|uniref:BTB domain-containing protein n=1 Tax=Chironomus riparius TaxID=315576 RepID=A0A9N9S627_9DIPT|nr:unnamed protein product [Chironomus riparius]
MQIDCKFIVRRHADGKSSHTCFIMNQTIPENAQLEFCGHHEYTKRMQPITEVLFDKCEISKVPQGLTKTFPNITSLSIWYSNLRNIDRSDLVEYKKLEKISFCNNEIEFLTGDLFKAFKNLENIAFNGNKLKIIEPTILDGLDNLKIVNFSGNVNYTKFFSVYPKHQPNATLEDVKNELFEKFYQNYQSVKNLVRNFQECIQKLQELNKKLRIENRMLSADNEALNETNQQLRKLSISSFDFNPNLDTKLTSKIDSNSKITNFLKTDQTFMDFKIIIKDHEFPVHKIVLAAQSPTFAELFNVNPAVEYLNLVDISVETFEIILKFLYTDELPGDNGTNFLHLFSAAGQFKIEELKEFAAIKLINHIDAESALEVLNFSEKYEHEELRQAALNIMKNKYPEVELIDFVEDSWM